MSLILLVMSWFCVEAKAVDIFWLRIHTEHSYKDATGQCKGVKPGGELYFASERDGDKLNRVVLSNFPNVWPYTYIYKSIELPKEQLSQVKLYRDKEGRFWLKELPLTERQLRWVLYYTTEHYSYCPLPQLLKTLEPAPITFGFETEGIDEGILRSYSQKENFHGTRSDGLAYEATLRLVQGQYER